MRKRLPTQDEDMAASSEQFEQLMETVRVQQQSIQNLEGRIQILQQGTETTFRGAEATHGQVQELSTLLQQILTAQDPQRDMLKELTKVGKLEKFYGEEADWMEWDFAFENWFSSLGGKFDEMFKLTYHVTASIPLPSDPETRRASTLLFNMLSMLMRNKAHKILRKAPKREWARSLQIAKSTLWSHGRIFGNKLDGKSDELHIQQEH